MSAPSGPSLRSSRAGVTTGDVMIGLGALTLLAGLLFPLLSSRAFRSHVRDATADVETVRTAARGVLNQSDAWPLAAPPGVVPTELSGAFVADTSWVRDGYTLEWTTWEVVDQVAEILIPDPAAAPGDAPPDSAVVGYVPSVRSVGALVVHSADTRLLAELLEAYGLDLSYVRDTTWTFVIDTGS